MAGGPSTPALVGAVANVGGLGFLAGAMVSPEALADAIVETRGLTSEVIGVNLFVPHPRQGGAAQYRAFSAALSSEAENYGVALGRPCHSDDDWTAKLEVVCDMRPDAVSFTFGSPTESQCRRLTSAGIMTLATVTTVNEAKVALGCGVDAIVAQGPCAGGHRATFDPLALPVDDPLDDLVAALIARLDCPVVAAGGLATSADVARVRSVGATAAQIGTALLLADEAGTDPLHRAALRDPQFEQTVLTRVFTGRFARALRNRFIDEHEQHAIFGFPEVAGITAPLRAAAVKLGDPHGASLWAGTAFRQAKTGSAADIVRSLATWNECDEGNQEWGTAPTG